MSAPPDHAENPDAALKLGLHQLFEYSVEQSFSSVVTLAFQPRWERDVDVDTFIEVDCMDKLSKYEKSEVPSVCLPLFDCPKVQYLKFEDDDIRPLLMKGVPHQAYEFVSNTDGVSDALAMVLETPGGFWTLCWNAPRQVYMDMTAMFVDLLCTLKITPNPAYIEKKL